MKCFVQIKKLNNPECFKTWFFKILMRTGWEICKKQSQIIPMEITDEKEKFFLTIETSKKNEIDEVETRYLMNTAVNKLSKNLKTVVILYYYNGMSIEEIAKVTGSLKATVKSRLFYARERCV